VQRATFSSSVLVSGPATEKLQVIYDKDATRTSTHALFYANVGNILAGCFVSKPRGKQKESMVRVELVRIDAITTKPIQGETHPDATLTPLHLMSIPIVLTHGQDPDMRALLGSFEDRPSLPHARELMEQAVRKAVTPPEFQQLFWGVPRVKNED
jgi:hypothetical protein